MFFLAFCLACRAVFFLLCVFFFVECVSVSLCYRSFPLVYTSVYCLTKRFRIFPPAQLFRELVEPWRVPLGRAVERLTA